jgi:hypothetical protein
MIKKIKPIKVSKVRVPRFEQAVTMPMPKAMKVKMMKTGKM